MGRRSRKAEWYAELREPIAAREALERHWFHRTEEEPRLGAMVTAETAQHEPLHRWVRYRQGFAPALVRLMLTEHPELRDGATGLPLLDPFSGSGTTVVECARRGTPATGVEAIASLAFLANVRMEREFPPLPELPPAAEWQALAPRLEHPLHRAALMLAVSRQYTTAGKLNPSAEPLPVLLAEVVTMMIDDLRYPVLATNTAVPGDARRLEMFEDDSMAGVLTSPPYLSRHDYTRITLPFESVYRFWYESEIADPSGAEQLRASPRAKRTARQDAPDRPEIAEICETLAGMNEPRLVRLVASYFADLRSVFVEMHRVLAGGRVAWIVVGGSRLKDVYIPSDLIAAELAEDCGFEVSAMRIARDLVGSRRKFGGIHVAPRETLLVLRKM